MHKRIKSITVAVGALGALALGGSALATASSRATASNPAPAAAVEKGSAADPGPAVQQGDQAAPDRPVVATGASTDPAGANDTRSPDKGKSVPENVPESASENASETAPADGPGGFADKGSVGGAQQQGEH